MAPEQFFFFHMTSRIVVLISGGGTNLQAILDATIAGILPAEVVLVVSNRSFAAGLERARQAKVPTKVMTWNREQEPRHMYDARVAAIVMKAEPDLIVLAGWMHLLTDGFLRHFHEECVINLHPALPGQFPGANAIENAFEAGVAESGVMVHTVVPEMDAGRTIASFSVARHPTDTLQSFGDRIRYVEKAVLVAAIAKQLSSFEAPLPTPSPTAPPPPPPPVINLPVLVSHGKVRDVYEIQNSDCLLMVATDRLSSFDRNVCEVPNKGHVLNRLSAWWFEHTRDIVPNHLVHADTDLPVSVVKRCEVFPVEFVVRGVITGSTSTSMWVRYQAGQRRFGGVQFEDGLRKNQRLAIPIVDPTTKSDVHDEPITEEEIVASGLMSEEDYETCHEYALDLFGAGQKLGARAGLMLADTKYEFGKTPEGQIVLVDELHTCDSSRWWDLESYHQRFENGEEPKRFDKDMIRVWLKERCNPYTVETLPPVPMSLIKKVSDVYIGFYERLTGLQFQPGFTPHPISLAALSASFVGKAPAEQGYLKEESEQ